MKYISKINALIYKLKDLDWRYISAFLAGLIASLFVFTWHLSGLTNHYLNSNELSTIGASSSGHEILANPLFLPYKLLLWLTIKVGSLNHPFFLRATSVAFSLIAVGLFMSIIRHYVKKKTTIVLASTLFITSLIFIHLGRLTDTSILLFLAPLVVLRAVMWLGSSIKTDTTHGALSELLFFLGIALTLYIPGVWLIWLAILSWKFKRLIAVIRSFKISKSLVAGLLAIILIVPLIYGLSIHNDLVLPWLGIDSRNLLSLGRLYSVVELPVKLFWSWSPHNASLWLDNQPIFGVFSSVAIITGIIYSLWQLKQKQIQNIFVLLFSLIILYLLDNKSIIMIASLLLIFLAIGIKCALDIWRRTFPRNPIAFGGAVFLLAIAVIFSVTLAFRSYFVAWRYAPTNHQVFNHKF